MENYDIGWAIKQMQDGRKVRRDAWRQDMFIYLVQFSVFEVNRPPLDQYYPVGTKINYEPHIDYSFGNRTCGVCTLDHADILARDWTLA